jgi:crossover junction endodeoxyribonuclease RusA
MNDKYVKERWTLEDDERPWTMNNERTWHWSKRATRTKSTREKFYWLSKIEKVPKLDYISVDIIPLYAGKGAVADTGAHFPAAKAAIDGIVDAGVIPDDNGKYIQKITFWSPIQNKNYGLRIVITNQAKE